MRVRHVPLGGVHPLGASDQFSEPNQTKGQQLYGEPTWIDNGTLMVTDVGSLFGDQVATYTVGGGDNSLTQWFSDPDTAVKQLQYGTITRQGDKLAFVASTQATAKDPRRSRRQRRTVRRQPGRR